MNLPAQITPDTLPEVAYRNQRVLTTELLATLYGTETVRIRQNHQQNADRFIAGTHYIRLEGEELGSFKLLCPQVVDKRAKSLMLWTERGAARHAKILDTDEAWDVFEKLEDGYFGKGDGPGVHVLLAENHHLKQENRRIKLENVQLVTKLRRYELDGADRFPVRVAEFRGVPFHLCLLNGQPLLLANDIAAYGKQAGLLDREYSLDAQCKALGLKADAFISIPMADMMKALDVAGRVVIAALGLSGTGNRKVRFLTILGAVKLKGKLPELYAWYWQEAVPAAVDLGELLPRSRALVEGGAQ